MQYDVVLVGGGLQSAMIALAVLSSKPAARVAIVERSARLGGNHTWSFHAGDVPDEARVWIDPLVVARWPGFDVAFPEVRRGFDTEYASVDSERLHEVVSAMLAASPGSRIYSGVAAQSVSGDSVALADGTILRAGLVVDARGPEQSPAGGAMGFQKFVGLELRLNRPSPLTRPRLMDANVAQTDGFRFVYVLPFAPDRVLVEDTYYSDTRELDAASIRAGVLLYAEQAGLDVASVIREEQGALPLPLDWPYAPSERAPLVAGFQGGFFHPTTGYSFPVAVRVARHVAAHLGGEVFGPEWRALVEHQARQVRFAIMLNRLLFVATPPHHRRDVLERFHKLPEATIRRFYALETTWTDRARIIVGRPPRGVSLSAAFSELTRRVSP